MPGRPLQSYQLSRAPPDSDGCLEAELAHGEGLGPVPRRWLQRCCWRAQNTVIPAPEPGTKAVPGAQWVLRTDVPGGWRAAPESPAPRPAQGFGSASLRCMWMGERAGPPRA